METATATPESLKELLLRMTNEAWERQEGILLARLGDEANKLKELIQAELAGRKLTVFIKEELGEQIELYPLVPGDILRLALPRHAGVDQADVAKYFPKARASKKAVQASGVTSAVRLAFSRELEAGKKRLVNLLPKVHFWDVDDSEETVPPAREIPRELIVPGDDEDDPERVKLILKNIAQWRQQEDLAPAAIAAKPKEDGNAPKSGNLLDLLLSHLSEFDLKRMEIPLDIVSKLRNVNVK